MTIDLVAAMVETMQHPAVTACLKKIIGEVNAQTAADVWMDQPSAARYVYGTDGKLTCFHALRRRWPTLDAMSSGTGKARRFKKSDLDEFIRHRAAK
jgi:hypothetical protein